MIARNGKISFFKTGIISGQMFAGIMMLVLLSTYVPTVTMAQRIQFGIFAKHDIQVNPVGAGTLNFNNSGSPIIINSNEVFTIDILNEHVAVFEIEAVGDQDLTLELVAPTALVSGENAIPLNIRFAYSNLGALDFVSARNQALEVGEGFSTIIIPVLRRQNDSPGSPPTPHYEGYQSPAHHVYLYVYGSLGPVGNIAAGNYNGQIQIYLRYAL